MALHQLLSVIGIASVKNKSLDLKFNIFVRIILKSVITNDRGEY